MGVRQVINVSVLLLPESIRLKLGDQAAKDLVELINNTNDRTKNSTLETAADRFERRLAEFKGEVKAEISQSKTEMIKWMFVFWLGQIVVLAGLIKYIK